MPSEEADIFVKNLIEEIKKRRAELGLSHERLAEKAKIDRPSIGRLESGERIPSILYFYDLAKGLDIPLSELIEMAEHLGDQAEDG